MQGAFYVGIDPAIFWKLTPYQLRVCISAHNEKKAYEHDLRAFMMWSNAMLVRVKGKDFPPLKKFKFGYNGKQDTGIDEESIRRVIRAHQRARK